jgi:hypothetical protein
LVIVYLTKHLALRHETVVWLRRRSLPHGMVPLERVNQYHLYRLAGKLLDLPRGEADQRDAWVSLTLARDELLPFVGNNPPVRLDVALGPAKALIEAIEDVLQECRNPFSGVGSPEEPSVIPGWKFYGVRTARERFEAVLSAECESRPAFIPPKRGIYDTEELVNAAAKAVPEALQPMLSAKASVELDSAGRCLAFGLFSAAGFHMCRAVEAVLEDYYCRFTGKSGTLRSWHDYIDALEKALNAGFSPAAEQQTLVYLNQLRSLNRNPIMHPRVVLDETDAFEIFDLGRAAISKMVKELIAASKAPRRRKPRMRAVP